MLNRSKGEQLRHTVTLNKGSQGMFSIVDNTSSTAILKSDDPPGMTGPSWHRVWPQAGDPVSGDTIHGILMQFIKAKSYTWRVDRLDSHGVVIDTPLDTDYTDPKVCFDAINVDIKVGL